MRASISYSDIYLVVWVRHHWWLPLSVHVLIPVLRHLGIRVSYVLRLDPVLHIKQHAHCPLANYTHTNTYIHIIIESVPNEMTTRYKQLVCPIGSAYIGGRGGEHLSGYVHIYILLLCI